MWPVAVYAGESWTLRKNEETRLDAFEMKGLRKILRVRGQQRKQLSSTLSVEESIRMTEDRDKWRKYVHGVANPRIEDG